MAFFRMALLRNFVLEFRFFVFFPRRIIIIIIIIIISSFRTALFCLFAWRHFISRFIISCDVFSSFPFFALHFFSLRKDKATKWHKQKGTSRQSQHTRQF